MAAWTVVDSEACYDGVAVDIPLVQVGVLTVGMLYSVKFTITNMTEGILQLQGFEGSNEYTEDGDYELIAFANLEDIRFNPSNDGADIFDGCISLIEVLEIPFYSIVDGDDNVVFEQIDETGVSASGRYIQYNIDWSDIADGCYYIKFENSSLEYRSDCFDVKLLHNCTKQITWSCNENAFGFNYSDLSFTQTLRIDARLWKPRYKALEKEVYEYSSGDLEITYVTKAKELLFTTEDLPDYVHDALSMALDSDNFFIDGIKYVFPSEETTPSWRKSSNLAPLEVTLRLSQNLRNVNCG